MSQRSLDRGSYFRLVDLAQERREEAERCFAAGAYLAASVLEAAALEAALIIAAANHEDELQRAGDWPCDILRLNLGELLRLATAHGWMRAASPEQETAARQANVARNLIHPGAAARATEHDAQIDEARAREIYETLEAVWRATWATINIFYPEDAETGVKRLRAHWRAHGAGSGGASSEKNM